MHGMKNLVTLKALPSTQAQRANLRIEIYRLNHWNAVSSGRGVITHDEAVIGVIELRRTLNHCFSEICTS